MILRDVKFQNIILIIVLAFFSIFVIYFYKNKKINNLAEERKKKHEVQKETVQIVVEKDQNVKNSLNINKYTSEDLLSNENTEQTNRSDDFQSIQLDDHNGTILIQNGSEQLIQIEN